MNPAFAGRAGADADVDVVLVPPPKEGGGGDGDVRAGRETRGNDDDATEAAREAAREDEPDRSFGARAIGGGVRVRAGHGGDADGALSGDGGGGTEDEEMEEEEEEEDRREDRNPSSSSARATEDDSKSEDGEDDSKSEDSGTPRRRLRGFHSRRRVRLRPRFLRRWRSRFHRRRGPASFWIGGERCPFRAGRR